MKRLAVTLAVALPGFVAALLSNREPACPLAAAGDASYSGRFVGAVSMGEPRQVIALRRNGRPVNGARLCVNTAMVGMSGMGYSVEGHELAPGRYQVGIQFGMAGEYRGNLIARDRGKEVSIPVDLNVASAPSSIRLR